MAEREPRGGSPLGRGLRWGEGETLAIPRPEGEATEASGLHLCGSAQRS